MVLYVKGPTLLKEWLRAQGPGDEAGYGGTQGGEGVGVVTLEVLGALIVRRWRAVQGGVDNGCLQGILLGAFGGERCKIPWLLL